MLHVVLTPMLCRRLHNVDSGDLLATTLRVIPDATKQAGSGSAVLQPDKHVKLQKANTTEHQQSQRGKLASQASAGGRPCHKGEKRENDTNSQGQVKSRNKKKNRLGQRARQQLGRAKQAGLGESCPNKSFMVSHTSWKQHYFTDTPLLHGVIMGHRDPSVFTLMLVWYM